MTTTRTNRLVALALGWREDFDGVDTAAGELPYWIQPDGCLDLHGPPNYANKPAAVGEMIEWLAHYHVTIQVAPRKAHVLVVDVLATLTDTRSTTLNRALCAAILRLQRRKAKEPKG